eukprot:scaffold12.g8095.t1
MRLLVLAIELGRDVFSGNGIYGRSQVRALAELGHQLCVVSGAPEQPQHEAHREGAAQLIEIPLPLWGRLDAGCAWREFAAGAGAPGVVALVAEFAPDAVLGVDWHSLPAYEALAGGLGAAGVAPPPFCFMNYRIYLRTAEDHHRDTIFQLEQRALEVAALATVLSRSDAAYMGEHLAAPGGPQLTPVHVLLPALRADMQRLPPPADRRPAGGGGGGCAGGAGCDGRGSACGAAEAGQGGRRQGERPQAERRQGEAGRSERTYLACCVRLSPEKEPERFVELACELQQRGSLARLGVTPVMLGAGWDMPYGQRLRARMEAEVQLHQSFMGPADLASVYARTLLNIHPCTYDAYGMTIVEAASQGAPSLVQGGGSVGATDLLDDADGEVLLADMSAGAARLADAVEALLADRAALAAVGRRAAAKARSWTERANAEALAALVAAAVPGLAADAPGLAADAQRSR